MRKMMCQANDIETGEGSAPSASQSDLGEDAEENETSPETFLGCVGIVMFVFCPILAIINDVSGILAFLVGCVMWGLAEWISRSERKRQTEEPQQREGDERTAWK
jgi:hypothetical protein